MNEMEVIAIANEIYGKNTPWHGVQRQRLLMLAERLIQAEREACAKMCDRMAARSSDIRAAALESAAESIRARGEKK
jgi:hypothetical protein